MNQIFNYLKRETQPHNIKYITKSFVLSINTSLLICTPTQSNYVTSYIIIISYPSQSPKQQQMETPSWAYYFTAWLATLALILLSLRHRRCRKVLNLPPGPKPWPIIGNLNLIGPLPHRSIYALSQKYGPIMKLKFGSFPVVVGSSVEMAKVFLKTHDVNFADRPKIAAGKYTTYNYSDITW